MLDLVRQRVYGIALGYEDLNDHDDLKRDPLLALALGKTDVEGKGRHRESDCGKLLASSSTLNRLELTPPATDDEIVASALQFVRKVSGSSKPSKSNSTPTSSCWAMW